MFPGGFMLGSSLLQRPAQATWPGKRCQVSSSCLIREGMN